MRWGFFVLLKNCWDIVLPKAQQLRLNSVVGRSVRNFFPAVLLSGGTATLPTLGVVHTLRRQTMRKVRYSTNLTQVRTTALHVRTSVKFLA